MQPIEIILLGLTFLVVVSLIMSLVTRLAWWLVLTPIRLAWAVVSLPFRILR